jgi:hypothetical protein
LRPLSLLIVLLLFIVHVILQFNSRLVRCLVSFLEILNVFLEGCLRLIS